MYAGDFATAAAEARKVIADKGATRATYLPLVMEAVAKGDLPAAEAAYDEMAKTGARGASLAGLGRGDLALYVAASTRRIQLKTGLLRTPLQEHSRRAAQAGDARRGAARGGTAAAGDGRGAPALRHRARRPCSFRPLAC